MSDWLLLLAAVTIGSLLSLIGGFYLIYGKLGAQSLQRVAVPFAAGALLAAAFLDLLPEAIELEDAETILLATLIGLIFFFVLERSLSWFHHHHDHSEHVKGRQNASLIIIGDIIHNFIDGLAIGAAFLVDPAVGLITTAAIAAHEIPQEIGDFGLLLAKGMSKRRVVAVNIFSALATVGGAVLIYAFGDTLGIPEGLLLAVTAGFFIYIAASDIIPTIHAEPKRRWANIQTAVLIFGLVIVGTISYATHELIPHEESGHEASKHRDEVHHNDSGHHE